MSGYTKECPNCGAEHKLRILRCGCGYEWQKGKEEPQRDPMHGCCSYTTGTSRCHYPGTFSESVKGDHRWYCSAHYGIDDPVTGSAIVHRSHEDYPRPDWSPAAARRRYELRVQKRMAEAGYGKKAAA